MKLLKAQRSDEGSVATRDSEQSFDEPVVDAEPIAEATAVSEPEDQSSSMHGTDDEPSRPRRIRWKRLLTYGVVPLLVVLLTVAAGYLKWHNVTQQQDAAAGVESVRAARDGTVALLSYGAATVEKDLDAAKARLTGQFLESYTSLTHDVVIPGAQQKQITAVATVPAAASLSASKDRAVALLFVDQTITVGQGQPTSTASTVRVTLDRVDNRWLISQFDPV